MSRESEILASRQMRDRVVVLLQREADIRIARGNRSGQTRAALLQGMAAQVRALQPAPALAHGDANG